MVEVLGVSAHRSASKFKEAGIKVDVISGVSAGSVIAAMYAFSEIPFGLKKV